MCLTLSFSTEFAQWRTHTTALLQPVLTLLSSLTSWQWLCFPTLYRALLKCPSAKSAFLSTPPRIALQPSAFSCPLLVRMLRIIIVINMLYFLIVSNYLTLYQILICYKGLLVSPLEYKEYKLHITTHILSLYKRESHLFYPLSEERDHTHIMQADDAPCWCPSHQKVTIFLAAWVPNPCTAWSNIQLVSWVISAFLQLKV